MVLALGLAATAAVNIAFGFGASYAWFIACWGINGLLQGMGAPACARCANFIGLPANWQLGCSIVTISILMCLQH